MRKTEHINMKKTGKEESKQLKKYKQFTDITKKNRSQNYVNLQLQYMYIYNNNSLHSLFW